MMPAFDASIVREAWEGDRSERSGPDWQDMAVGRQVRSFFCLSFKPCG